MSSKKDIFCRVFNIGDGGQVLATIIESKDAFCVSFESLFNSTVMYQNVECGGWDDAVDYMYSVTKEQAMDIRIDLGVEYQSLYGKKPY